MSSIHADPATNGTNFGCVTVTVDLDAGDCVIHAPQPGPVAAVPRRVRFHGQDEIQAAYHVQINLAATDPVARDIARALKFAHRQLKQRFSIKAEIEGLGPIHHIMHANNADAALARLCRVYPNRKIRNFRALRREVDTTQEPSA